MVHKLAEGGAQNGRLSIYKPLKPVAAKLLKYISNEIFKTFAFSTKFGVYADITNYFSGLAACHFV